MKGINLNKSISFQTNKENFDLIDNESQKYIEKKEKEQNSICVVSSKDRNSILYEFPSKYFKEFLEYIALDEKQFWKIIDKFRSPHLWKLQNKKWKLKKTIY